MRSFPRGVPRKFKRRDHPTLLSRGDKCMYVYSWYAIFFFLFFYALPIIISRRTRRPRVDAKWFPDRRTSSIETRFFRRENFILVLAELGGFPSTRFYWVNLEQEAAVTDRIYREKIVDRRRFVAFGLKTFAQVQEVISTDCACRSLCCSFETRSQTRPRSVNRFSSSLLDSCRE